jgi:RpiR family transcriptional regulator, carbohydrate utilization regulator
LTALLPAMNATLSDPKIGTVPAGSWLRHIAAVREQLSTAEQRVAALVLAQPHELLNQSIGTVARLAGVSEPTVIRCCRSLGCAGFSDFKMRLAQSMATGQAFVHADVGPGDSIAELAAKVFNKAAGTLLQVRGQLDPLRLEFAVDLLAAARRVEFYGLGSSGIVAADAQHKFFRLGLPSAAYSDAHVHGMAATMLRPGDVVVAISASGRTVDLLSSVALARESGADVIGITALGSPLARECTVALEIVVDEDTDIYTPMTTRLAQLAVVDVLAIGVALRQGPELLTRLQRAKESLRSKRVRGFE